MKKLPTLLLILTLAGACPVEMASAVGEGTDAAMAGATEVIGMLRTGRETGKTELPVAQPFYQRAHVRKIRPREGTIEIELDTGLEPEVRARRVWLATYDYEAGWTEAEVDARLDEWTELKAEWSYATKEQDVSMMALHSYITIPMTIEGTRESHDLAWMNLPDVVYYAVEFTDTSGELVRSVWLRGKANYRGCAHAARFEAWETGVCEEVTDREAGTVKYRAEGATDDEEVMTWAEEWRQTLAGRLGGVEVDLEGWEGLEELSEGILALLTQEEEKLDKIEMLLGKMAGVEAETARVAQARERIAKLRAGEGSDTDSGSGSGSSSGSGSGSGSASSSGPGLGFGEDGEMLGAGSGIGGGGGVEAGEGGGDTMTEATEATGGDATQGGPAVSGVAEGNIKMPEGEVREDTAQVAGKDEGEDEDEASKVITVKQTEAVEVPKLGGAKAKGDWIWWVLIGTVGALGVVLGVIVKRSRKSRR